MQTFQNSRIRVTVSEKIVAKFASQITPAFLGKHEKPEQAVRGRILSAAMTKLGNLHELANVRNEQVDNRKVIELAHNILARHHLLRHSKYDINNLLFRYENGYLLTQGQSLEISRANAYAKGLLSPISMQEARLESIKCLKDLGEDNSAKARAVNTMSEKISLLVNADNASAEWAIAEAAKLLTTSKQFEMDYRSAMAKSDGWVIEVIGDLPSQIGVCRVTQQ